MDMMSFPTWERGLKSESKVVYLMMHESFPTWERGLKLSKMLRMIAKYVVPHVGTWIEISVVIQRLRQIMVVPHVGTWIEIG